MALIQWVMRTATLWRATSTFLGRFRAAAGAVDRLCDAARLNSDDSSEILRSADLSANLPAPARLLFNGAASSDR